MSERAFWYENSEYDVSGNNSSDCDTDLPIQSTGTSEEKAIEISERASEKKEGESGEWKSGIAERGRIQSVLEHRLSAHCDECSTRSDPPFAYIFFHFWFFSILLRHYNALLLVLDIPTCFFFREGKRARSSFI